MNDEELQSKHLVQKASTVALTAFVLELALRSGMSLSEARARLGEFHEEAAKLAVEDALGSGSEPSEETVRQTGRFTPPRRCDYN